MGSRWQRSSAARRGRPECGSGCNRSAIARFRRDAASGLWAQFWRDRNVRFHRDMLCPPSPHLATPLDEVSADPTGIFWG